MDDSMNGSSAHTPDSSSASFTSANSTITVLPPRITVHTLQTTIDQFCKRSSEIQAHICKELGVTDYSMVELKSMWGRGNTKPTRE